MDNFYKLNLMMHNTEYINEINNAEILIIII